MIKPILLAPTKEAMVVKVVEVVMVVAVVTSTPMAMATLCQVILLIPMLA